MGAVKAAIWHGKSLNTGFTIQSLLYFKNRVQLKESENIKYQMDFNEKMKSITHKWNFTNDLLPRIKDLLDETYPPDMLDYVSGRISIGVTEVNFTRTGQIVVQSRNISDFSSKENCLDYILASCCIPGWAGKIFYES